MSELAQLLFARPSFISGVARILDFGGTLNEYNQSPTGDEADRRALAADWYAVGHELREATASFVRKTSPKR